MDAAPLPHSQVRAAATPSRDLTLRSASVPLLPDLDPSSDEKDSGGDGTRALVHGVGSPAAGGPGSRRRVAAGKGMSMTCGVTRAHMENKI